MEGVERREGRGVVGGVRRNGVLVLLLLLLLLRRRRRRQIGLLLGRDCG